MRLMCPGCQEQLRFVRGDYEIVATSDLQFTRDGSTIKPAVSPLEIAPQAIMVHQVTCPACGHAGPLKAWMVYVDCESCGNHLAKFPAALEVPARELYCERESSFLCLDCARRFSQCGSCSHSSECLLNEEE